MTAREHVLDRVLFDLIRPFICGAVLGEQTIGPEFSQAKQ